MVTMPTLLSNVKTGPVEVWMSLRAQSEADEAEIIVPTSNEGGRAAFAQSRGVRNRVKVPLSPSGSITGPDVLYMHHNTYRHGNKQARTLLCNARVAGWTRLGFQSKWLLSCRGVYFFFIVLS